MNSSWCLSVYYQYYVFICVCCSTVYRGSTMIGLVASTSHSESYSRSRETLNQSVVLATGRSHLTAMVIVKCGRCFFKCKDLDYCSSYVTAICDINLLFWSRLSGGLDLNLYYFYLKYL